MSLKVRTLLGGKSVSGGRKTVVLETPSTNDEAVRQNFQLQRKPAISYWCHRRLVLIGLYDLEHIKGKVIKCLAVKEGRMVEFKGIII
jgi:hypothetical protein